MLADVSWSQGVEDAWSNVARFVPQFIGFLLILLIGWFVAKAIARIVDRVLERVGFDRAVERGGVKRALARSQYDASDIVSKVVFWALMLLVPQLAFGIFGRNPVSDMIDSVVSYLPRVFVAIVIVVVASAIAAAARELIDAALGGLSYGRLLGTIAAAAVITIGVFAALDQLQIAPTIVNGLFYAALAIIVGSAIIAIGGGGIQPMRRRWEMALQRWDEEKQNISREMQGSGDRIRQRAEERKAQLSQATRTGSGQPQQQPTAWPAGGTATGTTTVITPAPPIAPPAGTATNDARLRGGNDLPPSATR